MALLVVVLGLTWGRVQAAADTAPATDRLGDPLPPGAVARLGTVRLQQGFSIGCVHFSPDGKTLATSGGKTIHLWELKNGKELRRFTHENALWVREFAFSPDGTKLVTSGAQTEVHVWDLATGKVMARLPIARNWANGLAFSPDGRTLAVAGPDALYLWDLITATSRQVKKATSPIAFSPSGKKIAYCNDDVRLYDMATGEDTVLLAGRKPNALAFSPDGKTLATGDHDRTARVWDVATSKERLRLQDSADRQGQEPGGVSLTFSPDGKILASTWWDRPVRLWDVATGKELRRCRGRPDIIRSLDFSPDGNRLAAVGARGLVQLFEVATGAPWCPFDRPPDVGRDVLFLRDSKTLLTANGISAASGDGDSVGVWDAATGRLLRQFQAYRGRGHVVWSGDGEVVAAVRFSDNRARLLRVSTGKELWQVPGKCLGPMALNEDGKRLATTWYEDRVIHVWDTATHKKLRRLELRGTAATRLTFSGDGTVLASGSVNMTGADETIRVWDLTTGRERWSYQPLGSEVFNFTFSPDAKLLATIGSVQMPRGSREERGEVRLWDVASGKELRRLEWSGDREYDIAFAPDSRMFATGTGHAVRLWEVATGRQRRVLRGHADLVTCLSFSLNGRQLASTSWDGTALVWDLTGPVTPMSAAELEAAWGALAGDDAARAYDAAGRLAANPAQALPLLRERLRSAPVPDARKVARLIADLDGEAFEVRNAAAQELSKLGDRAAPALRQVLAGRPSPEVRRQVERLLEDAAEQTPRRLRLLRAVEALEYTDTPEARRLLEALAGGAAGALQTREAKAALNRLRRR
jgi:WD40 repeat protein